jgi:acetyl esterase/lipase
MIRLALPVLLLLTSMLVVFKAPANFFWKVQIALTEFPFIPVGVSLIVLISSFALGKYRTAAIIMTATALVLFLLPVIRAYSQSGKLNEQLTAALGGGSGETFSAMKMFGSQPEAAPKEMIYKTANGKNITLDFYPAVAAKNAPCVIVIHGGSWSSGDNKQFAEWNAWLTTRGYHVAAINYRLAPEYKSPSQVEDTRDAIAFLKTQPQLKIDTSRFVLLGRSAGGQIALCAAYQLNLKEIAGVISVYAPADMVWGAAIKGNPLVLNTDAVFADYLGGPYAQFADKYYESSAVQHVKPGSPPTLVVHGDNDCMVSFIHSEHLDAALTANKVQHYFLRLKGATHACDYNLNGPSGQLMQTAITRFLTAVTE